MIQDEESKQYRFLDKEIESWKGFEYALREENSSLFNKMLTEIQDDEEYSKAAMARGKSYSAESLFMALIFQQQKMISHLIENLSRYNAS